MRSCVWVKRCRCAVMIGEPGTQQMDSLYVSLCLGLSLFFILAELIGQMVMKRQGQQVRLGIWGACLKWDPAGAGGWEYCVTQWEEIRKRT